MQTPTIVKGMLVLLVALAGGCKNESGTGSVPKDFSSPKATATTFMKAMMAGDAATMKAACEGTDEQFKVIEAMGSMAKGVTTLRDAAKAKFGPENSLSKQLQEEEDPVSMLEKSDFKIEGDTATMVSKDGSTKQDAMKLKKVGSEWKIDLASMPTDNSASILKFAPMATKAYEELAKEISVGKFANAADAQKELARKIAAAMTAGVEKPAGK